MRSTSRSTSTRRVGTVTSQPSSASRSAKPRLSRIRRTSASGIAAPSSPRSGRAAGAGRRARPARDSDRRPCRAPCPAPIDLEQRARALHRGHRQPRIGAALEAHAGLGLEAERLARAAHRQRVEVGALEHDRRACSSVTSRVGAAHHAGDGDRPLGVGNDQHLGRQRRASGRRASAASRRRARFCTRIWPPPSLREVERVHRLTELEQHVVGDVDDVADRPDAGGAQPRLHPVRRRPDLHVGDRARVARAQLRVLDDDVDVAGSSFERRT